MNRRVRVCIGLIVCSMGLTGIARAQIAATPPSIGGVSLQAKSAPDANPYRSQIREFVQSQTDALIGQDADAQKAAREKLIAECTSGSTPSYMEVYAQVINASCTEILGRNPPLRARLNVAVLVNEVGHLSRSRSLEGAVLILINDPTEPVALRGMQAARPVVSAIVANPATAGADKLMTAIPAAVKAHEKSGFIAAEAYHALIPDNTLVPSVLAGIDPLVLGPILDILNFRISLYTKIVPDNPAAETDVPTFLYRSYKNASVAVQHRIVQTLGDLIAVAGQQAPSAEKSELDEIITTLNYAAGALTANNSNIGTALDTITHLSRGSPASVVAQRAAAVYGLIKPFFPFLQPPPAVVAAPSPATKPD